MVRHKTKISDWSKLRGMQMNRYKFRTSPIRNVALQPAFFHNGAFTRLEDAVRHHLDVFASALNYDPLAAGVAPDLRGQFILPPKPQHQRRREASSADAGVRSSIGAAFVQSSIGSTPSCLSRSRPSFMALSASGECPCQFVTSPIIRRGSRERNDFIGLPRNFLFVRLGSSSIGPVGSTM